MTHAYRFARLDGDGQRGALEAIQAECFHAPVEALAKGTERAGLDQVRVVLAGERVLGGLWRVPMGQFFGGRSVPCVGIAGVGVHAAERGRGVAGFLMKEAVRELAAEGLALSALYPATVPLYRSAGYELAGGRYRLELPLTAVAARAVEPPLREAGPDDFPAMEACARDYAAGQDGHLDRGHYCTSRLRESRDQVMRHYVVEEQGEVTGTLSLVSVPSGSRELKSALALPDFAALTPGALRRLAAFVSTQASMSSSVHTFGAPNHPLLTTLPEFRATVTLDMPWMLRVVDLGAAFVARGWPAGLATELHLNVDDALIPDNSGAWRVLLADGQAQVERGGRGELRVGERGLAALYSGFQTPDQLASAGLLEAAPAVRAAARAAFAGPPPSMIDMF